MVSFDPLVSQLSPDEWESRAEWAQVAGHSPDWLDAFDELLVFAAHPDDETLGVGGLIALAAERRLPVTLVVATGDDETRRSELEAALRVLGCTASIRYLGLPDGRLKDDPDLLRAQIDEALGRRRGRTPLVVAPWPGDRHGDHRTLGREVGEACATGGLHVAFYPIWLWQWGDPSLMPWDRVTDLALPAGVRRRKGEAIHAFTSQLHGPGNPDGVLSPHLVERAAGGREVLISPEDPLIRHFERLHENDADPWSTRTSWYERRKRDLLLASLPRERYTRGLELGCSNGATSVDLAARCDRLVCLDAAQAAVDLATERTRDIDSVVVRRMRVPGEWPVGSFDLIVISELAYYLATDQWQATIDACVRSLAPGGSVVLCHWTGTADDFAQPGELAHAEFRRRSGLGRLISHREDDFLLEVFG